MKTAHLHIYLSVFLWVHELIFVSKIQTCWGIFVLWGIPTLGKLGGARNNRKYMIFSRVLQVNELIANFQAESWSKLIVKWKWSEEDVKWRGSSGELNVHKQQSSILFFGGERGKYCVSWGGIITSNTVGPVISKTEFLDFTFTDASTFWYPVTALLPHTCRFPGVCQVMEASVVAHVFMAAL